MFLLSRPTHRILIFILRMMQLHYDALAHILDRISQPHGLTRFAPYVWEKIEYSNTIGSLSADKKNKLSRHSTARCGSCGRLSPVSFLEHFSRLRSPLWRLCMGRRSDILRGLKGLSGLTATSAVRCHRAMAHIEICVSYPP
jgi:hypothetical protein